MGKRKEGVAMCNGFGSHVPALVTSVMAYPGRVLEVGVGYFSTTLLHNLHPEYILSVDTDPTWIGKCQWMELEYHKFRHVSDWDKLFEIIGLEWDVVLVDNNGYDARFDTIKRLQDTAKIIVVHDTGERHMEFWEEDGVTKEGLTELFGSFAYRIDYTGASPVTTLLSNIVDVRALVLDGLQ